MQLKIASAGQQLQAVFLLVLSLASQLAALGGSSHQHQRLSGSLSGTVRSSISVSGAVEASPAASPTSSVGRQRAPASLAEISEALAEDERRRTEVFAALPECLRGLFEEEARRMSEAKAHAAAHPPPSRELRSRVPWPLEMPIYVVHAPELEVRHMALAPLLEEATSTFWVEGFGEAGDAGDPNVVKCVLGEQAASVLATPHDGQRLRRKLSTTLKHWFIYWHMVKQGTPNALVLEDDAQPSPGWARSIAVLQRQELPSLGAESSQKGSVAEATYDFISLASCKPALGPDGRPRAELKYSHHLFAPTQRLPSRCYSAYLVSVAGAAKFLLSRLPSLRLHGFAGSSAEDSLGETVWTPGSNPRLYRHVPALFSKSQLGGSAFAAHGRLRQAFQAPRSPDALEIVRSILAKRPRASYVIDIGAGDGKGNGPNVDPVHLVFNRLNQPGVAIEADPQHAAALAQNLPSENIKKVSGVMVNPLNAADLLASAGAPKQSLYLRINIKGYDCAVIQSVLAAGFRPLAIHMQVNPEVPLPYIFGVHYDARLRRTRKTGGFYGCSLGLADGLLRPHGYHPVAAGGVHEVVYVQTSLLSKTGGSFEEVPLVYVAAAVKASLGSFSHFDQTSAGPAWRQVPWDAPHQAVVAATHALSQICGLLQSKISGVPPPDSKRLESTCALPFTMSSHVEDYTARALGIAASVAARKGQPASWATEELWAALVQITQQPLSGQLQRIETYKDLVAAPGTDKVCELGFDAGYSALGLLLKIRASATLISFDSSVQEHQKAAAAFLERAFPKQFIMVWGDTGKTLPEVSQSLSTPLCDLTVVDGPRQALPDDLANALFLSKANTAVVMHDMNCSSVPCASSTRAWVDAVKGGWVKQVLRSNGIIVGRFQTPAPWRAAFIALTVLVLGVILGVAIVAFDQSDSAKHRSIVKKFALFGLQSRPALISDIPLAPRVTPRLTVSEAFVDGPSLDNGRGREMLL